MAEQRKVESWPIEDVNDLKKCIYGLCNEFDTVFLYDSCSSQVAADTGKYELLLGLGKVDTCTPHRNALGQFAEWIPNDWVFGGLSYDLKNEIEDLRSENPDFLKFPELWFCIPQHVLSIDRSGQNLTISSLQEPPALYERLMNWNKSDKPDQNGGISLTTSTSQSEYLQTVEQIREEIRSGNVYEMNYCIQFKGEINSRVNGLDLFRELINISPVPFAGYARFNQFEVLSASPERYMMRSGTKVVSQPIKGTRSRAADPQTDLANKRGLQNSLKERAENVMIVDLVRNDLARSCRAGSIQVDELFGIYAFPQVFQMISTISGELENPIDKLESILKSYPMGSMTGAPKIAAMELIERFENFKRGWYSGSLGYIEPNGDFDFNVLIRSLFINRDSERIAYGVGGAITIDSEGEDEYDECMWKARAIRELLGS